MARYAISIFLSSFLLFQVQPLIGRFILPWFGGTPATWTACMLFFQVLLLAGYAYAHLLRSLAAPRWQGWVHLLLLFVSLAFLPIAPAETWKPSGADWPTWNILVLLAVTIGGPYLLLSATGPLLQAWFAENHPARSPYRLYALSNAGSLLALISYPLLVEPMLRSGHQSLAWSWGYAAFTACCGWCAWHELGVGRRKMTDISSVQDRSTLGEIVVRPNWLDIVQWLALAAAGSLMLLATTNQMCQEVAVVPFLWVLPLALYLLSFILCFDHQRWYWRPAYGLMLALLAPAAFFVFQRGEIMPLWLQIAIYCATLLVCVMIAHGELVLAKPHPRFLTLFYLCIAAGGAVGGIFEALLAPFIFHGYGEYYLGLGLCLTIAFVAGRRKQIGPLTWRAALRAGAVPFTLIALLLGGLGMQSRNEGRTVLLATRNFYGVLRVEEKSDAPGPRRLLYHGRTKHGSQFVEIDRRRRPTTYYGPRTGVGLAIQQHPNRHAHGGGPRHLRIGVVGLGVGTVASYGQAGDYLRYYEINPEVERLAREYFTYLSDSPAEIEVTLGDARIQMERQLDRGANPQFDVLAIDAFSSDSIPLHLLTKECGKIYWRLLKPDGILALHISNRHLDLKPVVAGLAQSEGKDRIWIHAPGDSALGTSDSDWVLLTSNAPFIEDPQVRAAATAWPADCASLLWTDDFGSLWQVIAKD